MATLYAGTSGFAYPAWKPAFYPAKLPANHELQAYDCAQVDGMPPAKLQQIKELNWLEQNFNLVVMGPNGVGKTLLAAGLCHHALQSPNGRKTAGQTPLTPARSFRDDNHPRQHQTEGDALRHRYPSGLR